MSRGLVCVLVLIHAKDFMKKNGEMVMVPIGKGMKDYHHLFEQMKGHKYELDTIIEAYQGKD